MSGVVFDPARAKVDVAYRTEAMELYKQGKLDISDSDLKWLQQVLGISEDENQYDIPDTDEGHGKFDLAVSTGALGASAIIGLNAASGLSGASAQLAAGNSAAAEIACITAFAIGTKYELTRPNKEQHENLEILKKAMEDDDIELANSLIELEESEANVADLTDEAAEVGETTEDELAKKQAELEEKLARIEELKTKAESEDGLTEDEQAELEALTGEVQVLQEEIEAMKGDAADDAGDIQDDIEGEQENIDESKGVFETILDVANYAETFDEATKDSATLEAVAQGVNAAMGYGAAAFFTFHSPLLSLTPYGQVLRGMALAGAAMSTHGVVEQTVFASDVGEEIDVRKNVQGNAEEAITETENGTQAVEDGVATVDDVINNLDEDESPAEPPTGPEPPIEPEPPAEPDGDGDDDDKKDPQEE